METFKILHALLLFQVIKTVSKAEIGSTVFLGNIPQNATEINITACAGEKAVHNIFVDHHMTWFQAMATCITLGFPTVDVAQESWIRHINIRNYLEDINYKDLNYTYWHGAFRPYLHSQKWYKRSCKEYPFDFADGDLNDGQCAIFRRNETAKYFETVVVEDCNSMHPFVCVKFLGDVNFMAYKGFGVTNTPLKAYLINRLNISFDDCKSDCYSDAWCNAFTYFNDSSHCTLIKRTPEVTIISYTIVQTAFDETHYAKTGCVVDFISNAVNVPVPNETTSMPDCGVDEIPQCYCPCEVSDLDVNVTSIQEIVNERIKNLTVHRKSTSAYQRRLNSSHDDRKVSKAFGALGIILIIGMLLSIVLSDIFLRETKKIRTKKKAKKRNGNGNGVEMQQI